MRADWSAKKGSWRFFCGEFRHDIEKYSRLVKKLKLQKSQFLVCATGLDEKQIQGFNSMYAVTFANEKNFVEHVQRVVT